MRPYKCNVNLVILAFQNSFDIETSPDDETNRASNSGEVASSSRAGMEDGAGRCPPMPTPNLARSLQALSTPRPPDNLAPGLVEQLPSEGSVFYLITMFTSLQCCCGCILNFVFGSCGPPRHSMIWQNFFYF